MQTSRTKKKNQTAILRRIAFGSIGGLTAVLIKFYMRDSPTITQIYQFEQWGGPIFGYCLAGICLSLFGGAAAQISELNRKRHLLYIGWVTAAVLGMMAPELEVPDPSEGKQGTILEKINPVSPAFAKNSNAETCIGDDAILRGFKLFFGIQERYNRYRVVVASTKDYDEAVVKTKSINAQDPSLKARVGLRNCASDYYPIVIGEDLSIQEAKKLLEVARTIDKGAYLSPVPRKK